MFTRCFACVTFTLVSAGFLAAEDWPQWQGPDRTAVCKETGLLKSWPKDGPKVAWKGKDLGGGYSTPSVAAGRVFGMGAKRKTEYVWALDEKTGKELWSAKVADPKDGVKYNEGPRCTPTVDGDLVFAMGVHGDLVCLEAASGKELWRKNLGSDFDGKMMSQWGFSESPLVDGDKLIVTPGGGTATIVALNKKDGKTIWKSKIAKGDGAGYSSAIAADVGGKRQYIQFLGKGVVGVDAGTGNFLWRYDRVANDSANCATPIYLDGKVFAASAYGKGGALIKLTGQGDNWKAEEEYFTKSMKNHHGGMVAVNGYLYGANGGNKDPETLVCLELKSGNVKWEEKQAGKGSITFADGKLYYRNENGPLILIEANPDKYVEISRFDQAERSKNKAWPHPVIANGKLFIRDQGIMWCYDLK